jgi:hypothetical protein
MTGWVVARAAGVLASGWGRAAPWLAAGAILAFAGFQTWRLDRAAERASASERAAIAATRERDTARAQLVAAERQHAIDVATIVASAEARRALAADSSSLREVIHDAERQAGAQPASAVWRAYLDRVRAVQQASPRVAGTP